LNRAFIILLNWNGWGDTIECLESLFRSDFPDYRVIVCDNGSDDGSIAMIKAWAEGRLDAFPALGPLRSLSFPPVAKPVKYLEYTKQEAEQGGDGDRESRLIIINNAANLGFAAGNNVALRYILARNDFYHVWLLNNDTVVQPDTLSRMVERMNEKSGAGMCGSTIHFYGRPDRVQALGGGWHCKWIGLPWHYGRIGWRGGDPLTQHGQRGG
jgi:GT2 family glycosyltransferase